MSSILFLLLAAPGFLVQPPGEFHGDEPVVVDGEHVLALHDDGERAWLEATRITMERVSDPLHDGPGGPETGWRVGAGSASGPGIVYLRGEGLKAGDVPRAQAVTPMEGIAGLAFHTPRSLDLRLGDALYRLVAGCEPREDAPRDSTPSLDCHIDLFAPDGNRSRLVAMSGYVDEAGNVGLGSDAAASLLFAGDLDGDGRLDLVFDVSDHYNIRRPTLFLSGAADGESVRAVAGHEAVGC